MSGVCLRSASIKRMYGIDAIRFVCALWVMLGHFGMPPLFSYVDGSHGVFRLLKMAYSIPISGPPAVIVFFVISGLCIHFPYRQGQKLLYSGYFARRYIRIGIPVLVAMGLSRFLQVEMPLFQESILWSLLAEIIYYTLYPLLMWTVRQFGWKATLVASFALAYGTVFIAPNNGSGNYPSFGPYLNWVVGLPCWLLGCRLAEDAGTCTTPSVAAIWAWRLGVLATSSVFVILRFHSPLKYSHTLDLFAILVYFWLKREISFYQSRGPWRWIEWAGAWSYSLYLVHILAFRIFDDHIKSFLRSPILNWVALTGFALSGAYLFYLVVERPSHLLARRFKDKPLGEESTTAVMEAGALARKN